MISDIVRRMGGNLTAYPGPWFICFIGLLALPFFTRHIPLVRLTEEKIRVTVHPRSITVDAFYYYRNPFPFPVRQGYVLPFPEDEDHSPLGGRMSNSFSGLGVGKRKLAGDTDVCLQQSLRMV